MSKDNTKLIRTQIRMGENLYEAVNQIAEKTGDSMNGTMLHLMYLGLRLYTGGVVIPEDRRAE